LINALFHRILTLKQTLFVGVSFFNFNNIFTSFEDTLAL
jgi:hypothetical protein